MEQQPDDRTPGRSNVVAIFLGASIAIAIGVVMWLATGNNAVGIAVAGGIGALISNMLRKGNK
jgi:hypothetical protein